MAQSKRAWEHLGSQKYFQWKSQEDFFFNKSCSDKNGKPSSGKFSFYFRFPVVAIHEYVKATKPPRAEARESS